MIDLKDIAKSSVANKDDEYLSLNIEKRIINTGGRSISIANIASITVYEADDRIGLKIILLIISVVCFIMAYSAGTGFSGSTQDAFIFAAIGSGFLIFLARLKSQWHLTISSSDGVRSIFHSKDSELLYQVKEALDEKINTGNDDIIAQFNFETGTIENLNLSTTGDIKVDELNAGNVNANGIQAGSMQAQNVVSNSSDVQIANQSPGAQIGNGNYASGNQYDTQFIDYSLYLNDVNNLRNHYAQSPGEQEIAVRLDELTALLKTGSPSTPEKTRVREIAGDMANYLQAYPALVTLFQNISALIV